MPLRDHFHPPLTDFRPWGAVHGQWPAVMVQQLRKLLPPPYYAMPSVYLGSPVEIDIGAFEGESLGDGGGVAVGEKTATAVWAPAQPTLALETEILDVDEYEVLIHDRSDRQAPNRLVAAIEIVSPANKDRPRNRRQFADKCADLLQQGVSVIIVDLVTDRGFNLYEELMDFLDEKDPSLGETPAAIYAVACRWLLRENRRRMETWNHPLSVGSALPTLPLWLSENLAVPLDLEASYEKTCDDLQIPS